MPILGVSVNRVLSSRAIAAFELRLPASLAALIDNSTPLVNSHKLRSAPRPSIHTGRCLSVLISQPSHSPMP